MKVYLVNSRNTVQITPILDLQPFPESGWRIVEDKIGYRRIVRNIKINGKWTTEDLRKYLYLDDKTNYKKRLAKIKFFKINKSRKTSQSIQQ